MNSSTALSNLKQDLEGRYPNSAVYRDVHAIVTEFSDGVKVDVVPSRFHGMTQANLPIYKMPDGNDDWMLTSPESHARYIAEADDRSRGEAQENRATDEILAAVSNSECTTLIVPYRDVTCCLADLRGGERLR